MFASFLKVIPLGIVSNSLGQMQVRWSFLVLLAVFFNTNYVGSNQVLDWVAYKGTY